MSVLHSTHLCREFLIPGRRNGLRYSSGFADESLIQIDIDVRVEHNELVGLTDL